MKVRQGIPNNEFIISFDEWSLVPNWELRPKVVIYISYLNPWIAKLKIARLKNNQQQLI